MDAPCGERGEADTTLMVTDSCNRHSRTERRGGNRGAERPPMFAILRKLQCGRGSVGRASPCQGEGRRFESGRPLQEVPGQRPFEGHLVVPCCFTVTIDTHNLPVSQSDSYYARCA